MGCAQEGAAGNGFLEPPSAAAAPATSLPLTVPHGGMSFLVLLHMPPSAVTAPSKWDGELRRFQYLVGAFTKREGPVQLGGLIGFVTLFHIVVQPDCMTNHCPCSVYQDQHVLTSVPLMHNLRLGLALAMVFGCVISSSGISVTNAGLSKWIYSGQGHTTTNFCIFGCIKFWRVTEAKEKEMMLAGSHAGPPRGQPPAHTGYPVLTLPPPMAEQSEDRTSEEIERGNT